MMKTPLGQAYNQDETRIYTWWSDGSVSYHEISKVGNGGLYISGEMEAPQGLKWNENDFLAFVPVAPMENKTDEE